MAEKLTIEEIDRRIANLNAEIDKTHTRWAHGEIKALSSHDQRVFALTQAIEGYEKQRAQLIAKGES